MASITLGGNPAQTTGDLPAVGTQSPDFTLTKSDMSNLALSDLAGKRVILNIFPSVDTGVCAASARHFNQAAASLDNTVVICISKDLPFAQTRFCAAEGLEDVMMGSDFREPSFTEGYKVEITDGGFRGLMSRAVVVLDADHKVIYTEQVPEIGQAPNYDAALAALS